MVIEYEVINNIARQKGRTILYLDKVKGEKLVLSFPFIDEWAVTRLEVMYSGCDKQYLDLDEECGVRIPNAYIKKNTLLSMRLIILNTNGTLHKVINVYPLVFRSMDDSLKNTIAIQDFSDGLTERVGSLEGKEAEISLTLNETRAAIKELGKTITGLESEISCLKGVVSALDNKVNDPLNLE